LTKSKVEEEKVQSQAATDKRSIVVGMSTCNIAAGAQEVFLTCAIKQWRKRDSMST